MKQTSKLSSNEIYKFAKQKGLLLHLCFIKKKRLQEIIPEITYRKINDWDKKGLLSCSRNKISGWRLFGILDIIKIQIISDLRHFCLPTNIIKTILNNISDTSLFLPNKDNTKREMTGLEYIIFSSMLGQKTLLEIDNKGNVTLLTEDDITKTRSLSNKLPSSVLILPFYAYAKKIVASVKHDIKQDKETSDKSLMVSGKS